MLNNQNMVISGFISIVQVWLGPDMKIWLDFGRGRIYMISGATLVSCGKYVADSTESMLVLTVTWHWA